MITAAHQVDQHELTQHDLSQRELTQHELTQRELTQRELTQHELSPHGGIQQESSQHGVTEHELEQAMRAARVFAGVTAESVAQAGDAVTAPQLRVLVLASAGEPLNTTGVAAALDVHVSNASRICDRLVTAGFLDRRESTADRRTVELSLTTAGEDLVSTVMSHRRSAFARIFARMSSDDRATLTEGLRRLCDSADEYSVPALNQR